MVRVIACDEKEFLSRIRGKDIFCFGIGREFQRFCDKFDEIYISGIIDNYHYLDEKPIVKKGVHYHIMSLEKAVPALSSNSVIVITSRAFEDIIEQLDHIGELDGLECYIEMSFDGYQGISETEQAAWKCLVTGLAERKKEKIEKRHFASDNHCDGINRFQVWDYVMAECIRGNKARADVRHIAEQMGYQAVKIHRSRGAANEAVQKCSRIQIEQEWQRFYDMLPFHAVIFLQHPFPVRQPERDRMLLKIKREKSAHFIAVVHDVEQLRVVYDSAYRQAEYEFMLQIADVYIVHNDKMKAFFVEQGIPEERLVCLQIFDYLYEKELEKKEFAPSINIAGNLGQEKSPYIRKLRELDPIKVHLYGSNFNRELIEESKNMIYHGYFPAEELPGMFRHGFGLVWDGESLDTCSGATGNYLRYNNPHKLSLYLAAGLPVIVWAESAEADFVGKYGLGLIVHSLYELIDILNHMDKTEYEKYLSAVSTISEKIRDGYYMKQAIIEAEERIKILVMR